MNRRSFIRNSAIAGTTLAAMGTGSALWLKNNGGIKLTILHTNDVHSRIDPFPSTDAKFPNMGGFARRAAMIKQIRQKEENVLLFDSGDIFQGTPYFNYYGGELEFKLMSEMGYDAATLGNHDFDNGIDGLVRQLPHANFPFINANYDVSNSELAPHIRPFKLFDIDGIRIGVFGLGIELNGLVHPRLYPNVQYQDPIQKANEIADHLKHDMECDLIICLSHLGYEYSTDKVSDKVIASRCRNIDFILGGHTHTFLDSPDIIYDVESKPVMVCQTGWAGVRLGRIDLYIDRLTRVFHPAYIALKVLESQ
jgi:5'-nucleotidase